ncbi:MAG: 30S ribosomal protein S1, partial [Alphaproteobacteria bacterium]|nr:30S ribosomal protein S1 [Alphaproteobacteria bacterium]
MSDEKLMDAASFEALLTQADSAPREGFLTKATVLAVDKAGIHVDVGLKTESIISPREFGGDEVNVGDIVDVYVERYEGPTGSVIASRSKARREKAWVILEEKIANGESIEGSIIENVRGGFIVDVYGVQAFMPGSHAGTRPNEKIEIPSEKQEFKVIKMDRARANVIVSRRAVLEKTQRANREEFLQNMKVDSVVKGIVKNITDYGAFVDIGGLDGLLHVTDLSWKRVNHPKEILKVGQELDVKIIEFDKETQRVSLGVKQLTDNPWAEEFAKIKVGSRLTGKVSSVTDYGAFVELESGLEGLIHMSEMSWTKKNIHPSKIVSEGETVEVEVLEIDTEKRRLSFGLKQCKPNPWDAYTKEHAIGDIVESTIKNITEFGLFIGLNDEIDGMVHIGDLDWDKSGEEAIKEYKIGDKIKAKILDIKPEKERISLSLKHAVEDRTESAATASAKKGQVAKAVITEITDNALIVEFDGAKGMISKMDLAQSKADCDLGKFKVGETVEAKVLSTLKDGMTKLSIKAHETEEQKKVLKEYDKPAESGSVLKDILG